MAGKDQIESIKDGLPYVIGNLQRKPTLEMLKATLINIKKIGMKSKTKNTGNFGLMTT